MRLDGIAAAATIKDELRTRVAGLAARGIMPDLGTLLVGDDPGSRSYVTGKHQDCAEVGVASVSIELRASASLDEVAEAVRALNDDPAVTVFIVQVPLAGHIDENAVIEMIDPSEDADELHPTSLGRVVLGVDQLSAFPTPYRRHE